MTLPLRRKYVRRAMLCLLSIALVSPSFSILLLGSAVYAQVTQCNSQTNAIVFSNSFTSSSITAGVPFSLTLYVCDGSAQINTAFNGTVTLSDTTNTMSPTTTSTFTNGVWTGNVIITKTASPDVINAASGSSLRGASNGFVVNPGTQEFLSLIGGSAQTGQVGSTLPQALTVKSIDQFGNPIPNIGVNFSIPGYPPSSAGQALTSYSVITNGSGQASTTVTLGSKIGTYTVNASIGGGTNISSGVNLYENATSGPLHTLKLSPLTTILPKGGSQPFSVTGTDQYGNPVNLSPPTWSVINGGGSIDVNGNFTAGTTPGIYLNTVKVSIGSIGALASVTVINEDVGESSGAGTGGTSGGGTTGVTATPTTPTPSQNYVTVTPTLAPVVIDHVTINPNPVTVAAGGTVIVHVQAYDVDNNPINDTQVNWSLSAGAGTLSQDYGNATTINASKTPGNGSIIAVVTDATGSKSASAQVIIQAVPESQKLLNTNIGGGHLLFKTIASPQQAGVPFDIVILAEDNNNNILGSFTGPVSLSDTTKTISPGTADVFNSGVWNGNVTITEPIDKDIITASGLGYSGTSNEFQVQGKSANPLVNLGNSLKNVVVEASKQSSNNALRVLASGIAAGLGLFGSSISIGFMSARGLEAIGRNPFARTKIQIALTISLVLCMLVAILSIASAALIK